MTGSKQTRSSRAGLWLGAVALMALAGVVALLWPSFARLVVVEPAPPAPPPPRAYALPPTVRARPVAKRVAAAVAQDTPAAKGDDEVAGAAAGLDAPTLVSLAKRAADDYRKRARYPRWSQPVENGEDPILRDRQVSPVEGRGPDGAEPVLVVFPERVGFESPKAANLYAYLSVGGERVPAQQIVGEVQTEDLRTVATLDYRDDGQGADAAEGDRIYSATFKPGPDLTPELSRSFLVRVRAITADGQERIAATGFLYSTPHARLTGRYRDAMAGGDLVVDAEVEVFEAGRFHLEATLYGSDQQAIAWAQTAAELAPGRHWMSLRYYGLILHERQIDGPYVLRFVALSTTTAMPNGRNDLVENAYVTGAYTASAFQSKPFNDPGLLDAARRVERDTQQAPLGAGG